MLSDRVMISQTIDGLPLLQFEILRPFDELACAISMRQGPGGADFNLGPVRGPQRGERSANWRRLADTLGLRHVWPQLQVHGGAIHYVTHRCDDILAVPEADASFTGLSGLGLLAFSADCPLVALYEPGRGVGVVHASWRSTVTRIVQRTVEAMTAQLGCAPGAMWSAIGPSAGPCCYEVGPEVFDAAAELPNRDACFTEVDGRRHFDLWQAAEGQLRAAGLRPSHIQTAGVCTLCQTGRFFSYRQEGRGVGQFGLMVGRRDR